MFKSHSDTFIRDVLACASGNHGPASVARTGP